MYMTVSKERFGELVDKLVHHIAIKKRGAKKYQVTEQEIADLFFVSQSTVQTWRQGRHLPADYEEIAEKLVRYGIRSGMDRAWAEALLANVGHPGRERILLELFPPSHVTPRRPDPVIPPDAGESPEDPVPVHSVFYLERSADRHALDAITRQGVTMTIKGPAKMGKTSLLYRVRAAAEAHGKRTLCLNFREFDGQALTDANTFFTQFCRRISEELGLADQVDATWNTTSTNPANCRRYITRHILQDAESTIVLALENVDTIFGAPFRSDFFGMLRSWHDDSQYRPIWKKLDRVLVTSTEPYQFIEDINKSPFNVGEVIDLDDFTLEQVADLNRRHGTPLTADELFRLMHLLNGHPYLVRRALYLVSKQFITATDLFAQATSEDGPFRAHLAALLADLMDSKAEVRQALQQVISQQSCADHQLYFRLRGAGLVRREGQKVYPRCQLYADFFQERLAKR